MKRILILIFFIFNIVVYAASEGGTIYYPQDADELNSTIAKVDAGDVIELNASAEYILTESLPMIDTDLIINGNGAVIDGNKTYSVFRVGSNGNVSLNNITIENAYDRDVVAIVLKKDAVVNVDSCSFINNIRVARNGEDGIENEGDGEDGGDAYGGAIINDGTLNIINSLFSNNQVVGGDGGNGADETEENSAGNGGNGGNAYGAAIYNTPDAIISLSSIRLYDNNAIGGKGGKGGAGEESSGIDGQDGSYSPGSVLYGIEFINFHFANIDINKHNITAIYMIDDNGTSINIADSYQFNDGDETLTATIKYGHRYSIKFVLDDGSQWWYNYNNFKLYETQGKDEDFKKELNIENNNLMFDGDDLNWCLDTKFRFMAQGGALEFSADGKLVGLDTNFINSDHNFTVEFWLRTINDNDALILFGQSEDSSYISINDGRIDAYGNLSSVAYVNDGVWHHIAVVNSNDTANGKYKRSIYIDGMLDNNVTKDRDLPEFDDHDETMLSLSIKSFNGFSIDELRIWNKARDEQQINKYKNVQLLGNEENVAGYYNFDEQNGNRVYDRGTFTYKGHLDKNVIRINPIGIDAPKIYGDRFVVLRDTNATIYFEVDNNKTTPSFSVTSPNADVNVSKKEIFYTVVGNHDEDFNVTMSLSDEEDITKYIKIISLNLPLNPPSNLRAEHNISSVILTWDDNSDNEDGFNIVRYMWDKNDNGSIVDTDYVLKNGVEINNTIGENITTFTDDTVDVNQRYSYVVLADNQDGISNSQSLDVDFDINVSLDISDLNLSKYNISSITFIGQNGSIRNIPVNIDELEDGDNHITLNLIDGYYAVKFVLKDGSSWWYNYSDAYLYKTIDASGNFFKMFDDLSNSVAVNTSFNKWRSRTPLISINEKLSEFFGSIDFNGTSNSIVISKDGTKAYVANGDKGLSIVNIENPSSPSVFGNVDFDGYAMEVKLSSDETKAYIANGTKGLSVIDISNPSSPVVIGNVDTGERTIGVVLSNDETKAYVTDEDDGLTIVDINDSSSLSILGNLDINETMMEKIVLSGDGTKAFVTDWEGSILALDISNSTLPSKIGYLDVSQFATYIKLSKDSTKAYVVQQNSGLSIIDISDPSSMSVLGTFKKDGLSLDVVLSKDGTKAYLQGLLSGLSVVDINNPESPTLLKHIDIDCMSANFRLSNDETKVYMTNYMGGLIISDITLPSDNNIIATRDDIRNLYTIKLSNSNKKAYVVASVSEVNDIGFYILNIENLNSISILGSVSLDSISRSISISGDGTRAYITDINGKLIVVDISNPYFPVILGAVHTTNEAPALDVVLSTDQTKAYVANDWDGVSIIDITNPSSMSVINRIETNSSVSNIALSNDNKKLFIANKVEGLSIVDITNPMSPLVLGVIDTETAYNIILNRDNTKAYVGMFDYNGFKIIDINNPEEMKILGTFNNVHLYDAKISNDDKKLFIANGLGIITVDVSNPTDLKTIGCLFKNNISENYIAVGMDISKNEDKIYIANSRNISVYNSALDLYLPKNFITHNLDISLDDFEGDNLNISVDINDTNIATVGSYPHSLNASDYKDKKIFIPIESVLDSTGVALVKINVGDGVNHTSKSFYLKVYEAHESISMDISDLDLNQKAVKNIQYIGEHDNNETFILEGSQHLVDGTNHLEVPINNDRKDFSLKFNMQDERFYWYNFKDHKLYQEKGADAEFVSNINRANNNFSLNAISSNWIFANTTPTVSKIYDLFLPPDSTSVNISLMIGDEARNDLTVEVLVDGSVINSNVFDYATYGSSPVEVSVEADKEYEVKVVSENHNSAQRHFITETLDNKNIFDVITRQETQDIYDAVSDVEFSGNLYSISSHIENEKHIVEYERHHINTSLVDKEVDILDTDGVVEFFEKTPMLPTSMKIKEAVSHDETSALYKDYGMDFDFTNPDSKSQRVYVKYDDAHLMMFDDYYGRDQNLTFNSLEDFLNSVIDDNSYGLVRNCYKNKILTIDKHYIGDSSGVLIEKDQNGVTLNTNAGVWNKTVVDGFNILILYPTGNKYRYGEAFVLDGNKIRFANYIPAGNIFSIVLLNKSAKDEIYHTLSPNPKIKAQLNNGYTYLSLPMSKLLCDEDVKTSYARCDQSNTLDSVFGVNHDIKALFKYANGWTYWNSENGANPRFVIPKYSTLSPLDGVLVKTSAQTSIMIPFDEDSLIVNNYKYLFPKGWILLSNNDGQSVNQIESALENEGKRLIYILVLRDGVWNIYAPTNDADIDASIPRIDNIRRYENYWIYFESI